MIYLKYNLKYILMFTFSYIFKSPLMNMKLIFERFKKHDVDYQHNGKGGSLISLSSTNMDLTMILATIHLEGQ